MKRRFRFMTNILRGRNKMRYKIGFFLCLFILGMTCVSEAEILLNQRDQAKLGKAQSLNNLGKHEAAMPFLEELFAEYPENDSVVVEYFRAKVKAGNKKEAVELLRKFLKNYIPADHNQYTALRLIEFSSSLRLYDDAIKLSESFLKLYPDNEEARTWYARVLSWDQKYKESIKEYDWLITRSPENIDVKRERARVLGWMRNYSQALDAYQETEDLADTGAGIIAIEKKAKDAFYHFDDLRAVPLYKEWLKQEPNHPEALFDSAQVHSRLGNYMHAKELYQKLLRIIPDHPQANIAFERLKVLSDQNSLIAGVRFKEADSGSRSVDYRRQELYEKISFSLSPSTRLNLLQSNIRYSFANLSSVQVQKEGVSVQFHPYAKLFGEVGYALSHYTEGFNESHSGFARATWLFNDMLKVKFLYQGDDVIENRQSLQRNIRKNIYQFRIESDPIRPLQVGTDYSYASYSDHNDQHVYGVDAMYHLFFSPRRLSLKYRYEAYWFDEVVPEYYSPGHFHTNEIGVEWSQFLNEGELFWGSQDTYYTVGYAVSLDVRNQTGHKAYAKFHKDWSSSFATELNWSKKMYEHEGVYSEDVLTFDCQIYF